MKRILRLFNHEIWRYCKECNILWDARDTISLKCQKCGKEGERG